MVTKQAAEPPYKVGPKKQPYPGDTVPNNDQGINEPFGDEQGLKAPPGARGEFVEGRPPGNVGVPIQPISPSVTDDNTRRRDLIPPMYLPNVAHRINTEDIEKRIIQAAQFTYHVETTGYSRGQTDGTIIARDSEGIGQGYLDWSEYDNEVLIHMVKVAPEYQRMGIGTGLVNELKKQFPEPEYTIDWGYVTEEGTSLRKRFAFSVYPFPKQQQPQDDGKLLLQIPHDVQERYNDLHRRVGDYIKNAKLNKLDMYDFPKDPPKDWIEEEYRGIPVDWNDQEAWTTYFSRLSHDDVADWISLESMDGSKIAEISPNLFAFHALEGTGEDFPTWFRKRRPPLTDENLVNYVKESSQTFPEYGLGRGYENYWRRKNFGMTHGEAIRRAKEKHDRYLHEVAYGDYVRPQLQGAFQIVSRGQSEHVSLMDLIDNLAHLPFGGEDRNIINGFQGEWEGLVSEGMNALDFHRPPVSRDDRLFGNMEYRGIKEISLEDINGEVTPGGKGTTSVYRYGNRFFLIDPSEPIPTDKILAHVYNVIPGSSLCKKVAKTAEEWERRTRLLSTAIREIEAGGDKEAVFEKYGREFGPDLRKFVDDYLYVSNLQKESSGGASGSTIGDSTCSSFAEQTSDGCGGCTFNVGTGGPEFGYGGCVLTHLFLNAPQKGVGQGDPAAYDPEHIPGNPSVQQHRHQHQAAVESGPENPYPITKQQVEKIIERAYALGKEYYWEEGIKNWRQWWAQRPDEVQLIIENDGNLYNAMLRNTPDASIGEILDAYKAGQLSDVYTPPYRVEPSAIPGEAVAPQEPFEAPRPWSPPRREESVPEEAKALYERAVSRYSPKHPEILEARKDLFLAYNTDPALAEKIGISKVELGKKIRQYTGLSAAGLQYEASVNTNVPQDFQWAGISNSSYLKGMSLQPDDLQKFVGQVQVRNEKLYESREGDYLRRLIATTFMAIDTRFSYKDLNFEMVSFGQLKEEGRRSYNGMYDDSNRTILIAHTQQSTVSHEIGHYLDYKFSHEIGAIGGLSTNTEISPSSKHWAGKVSPEWLAWIEKYHKFVDAISDRADVSSEYLQRRSEIFARFIARFVQWVDKKGGRSRIYQNDFETTGRGDRFSESDFQNWIHLMQEKAYLDTTSQETFSENS